MNAWLRRAWVVALCGCGGGVVHESTAPVSAAADVSERRVAEAGVTVTLPAELRGRRVHLMREVTRCYFRAWHELTVAALPNDDAPLMLPASDVLLWAETSAGANCNAGQVWAVSAAGRLERWPGADERCPVLVDRP